MTYRIVDADTYQDEQTGEVFRLSQANAPEKFTPEGQAAMADPTLATRLNAATPQRQGRDYYGRTVARFQNPDQTDLGQAQVEKGSAFPVDYLGSGQSYSTPYKPPEPPTPRQQKMLGEQPVAEMYKASPALPEPTFVQRLNRSVKRGTDEYQAGLYGGMSAVGELIANDSTKALRESDPSKLSLRDRFSNWLIRTGEKGYMRNMAEATQNPATTSLQKAIDSGSAGELLNWAAEAMGSALPSMAEMVGTGLLTAATGGIGGAAVGAARGAAMRASARALVGKMRMQLVETGMTPLIANQTAKGIVENLPQHLARSYAARAASVGQKVGMFGSSALSQAGQTYKDVENETGIRAPGAALLTGAAQGALDVAGFELLLGRFLKKGIPADTARELVKHVATEAGIGTMGEGVTEGVQEIIGTLNSEYHRPSDVPLVDRMLSKDNLWRYTEAAAAGALFGGAFGGVGAGAKGTYEAATAKGRAKRETEAEARTAQAKATLDARTLAADTQAQAQAQAQAQTATETPAPPAPPAPPTTGVGEQTAPSPPAPPIQKSTPPITPTESEGETTTTGTLSAENEAATVPTAEPSAHGPKMVEFLSRVTKGNLDRAAPFVEAANDVVSKAIDSGTFSVFLGSDKQIGEYDQLKIAAYRELLEAKGYTLGEFTSHEKSGTATAPIIKQSPTPEAPTVTPTPEAPTVTPTPEAPPVTPTPEAPPVTPAPEAPAATPQGRRWQQPRTSLSLTEKQGHVFDNAAEARDVASRVLGPLNITSTVAPRQGEKFGLSHRMLEPDIAGAKGTTQAGDATIPVAVLSALQQTADRIQSEEGPGGLSGMDRVAALALNAKTEKETRGTDAPTIIARANDGTSTMPSLQDAYTLALGRGLQPGEFTIRGVTNKKGKFEGYQAINLKPFVQDTATDTFTSATPREKTFDEQVAEQAAPAPSLVEALRARGEDVVKSGSTITSTLARAEAEPSWAPTDEQAAQWDAQLRESAPAVKAEDESVWADFEAPKTKAPKAEASKSTGTVDNPIIGDIWEQPGKVVITTNLGGVHGRGLAKQAKDKGFITNKHRDFDSSPQNRVITLAVKGWAPETQLVKGQAYSEQVTGKNLELLQSEVNKLADYAKAHPDVQINVPFAGLGFGEGNKDEILPILRRLDSLPNIRFVALSKEARQTHAESLKPGVRGKTQAEAPKAEAPKAEAEAPKAKPKPNVTFSDEASEVPPWEDIPEAEAPKAEIDYSKVSNEELDKLYTKRRAELGPDFYNDPVLARIFDEQDKRGLLPFSKRTTPTPGTTPQQFEAELQKTIGKRLTKTLLSRPNITVLHRVSDAPFTVAADTAGLYLPDGRVFFFTENILPGEAFGKLVHEQGAHYGLRRMLGDALYDHVLQELQRMVAAPEGFQSVKDAHARAVQATGKDSPNLWHETLAYLAEASPRHGLIRRIVNAIKQFFLKLGIPVGRLSDKDIVGLVQVAAFRDGAQSTTGVREALASKSEPVQQRVMTALRFLSSDDALFQYKDSNETALDRIANDILPGRITVKPAPQWFWELKNDKGDYPTQVWSMSMPGGKPAIISEFADGTFFIDASALKSGAGKGAALYHILATYAYNNDKVFVRDPKGLSEAGSFRSLQNLTSSAIRFGTTRHFRLAESQGVKWSDNDAENLLNLLEKSVETTIAKVPQLKDIHYDFQQDRFVNARTGAGVTEESFDRLRDRVEAETSNVGSATLRRAAFFRSLVQGAGSEVSWQQILGSIDRELSRGVHAGALAGSLYSRRTDSSTPELTILPYQVVENSGHVKQLWAIWGKGHRIDQFDSQVEAERALVKDRAQYEQDVAGLPEVTPKYSSGAMNQGPVKNLPSGKTPPVPPASPKQREAALRPDTVENLRNPPPVEGATPKRETVEKPVESSLTLPKVAELPTYQRMAASLVKEFEEARDNINARRKEQGQPALSEAEQNELRDQLLVDAADELFDARPTALSTFARVVQTIDQGLPRAREVAALDELYKDSHANLEALRGLFGFGAEKLAMPEQWRRAVQLWHLYSVRESSVLNEFFPAKDDGKATAADDRSAAWDAVRKWITGTTGDGSEGELSGMQVERGFEASIPVFRGQHFTKDLAAYLNPRTPKTALGQSETDYLKSLDRADEAMVHDDEALELRLATGALIDLRDKAAAAPEKRASLPMGSVLAWLGLEGELTPIGKAIQQFLADQSVHAKSNVAKAARAMAELPEQLRKRYEGSDLQAIYDAYGPEMPLANLVITFDARTNQYSITQELVTGNPFTEMMAYDWRTGEVISVKEFVNRYLEGKTDASEGQWMSEIARLTQEQARAQRKGIEWNQAQSPRGQRLIEAWKAKGLTFKNKFVGVTKKGKEQASLFADDARTMHVGALYITQLGRALGKALGKTFSSDLEAFNEGLIGLKLEAGWHLVTPQAELADKDISGSTKRVMLYRDALKLDSQKQPKGWEPGSEGRYNYTLDELQQAEEAYKREFDGTKASHLKGLSAIEQEFADNPQMQDEFARLFKKLWRTSLDKVSRDWRKPEEEQGAPSKVELRRNMLRAIKDHRDEYVDYQESERPIEEYREQYGTDIGNAPPAVRDTAMAREQDAEDRKWQEIRSRDVGGKNSTAVTGTPQNLPVSQGGVTASKNTARTNAFKLVKALADALPLKGLNIQVYNDKDIAALTDRLYQQNPLLGLEFETRTTEGRLPAMVTFAGDQVLIYYDSNRTDGEVVDAIGHEMGHVVFRALLDQERVRNTPLWNRILNDYRLSGSEQGFMEWFADGVKDWAVNKGKVESAKGALFKRVVDAIKRILEIVGLKPTPGAVSAYLDGLVLREKTLEQKAFLEGLQGAPYDRLTFAQAVNSTTTPFLNIPQAMDFLTLDGVKRGTLERLHALEERFPKLKTFLGTIGQVSEVAQDIFRTLNGWLRAQGSGELTLLADILDNQARGADQIKLYSNDELRQALTTLLEEQDATERQLAREQNRAPRQQYDAAGRAQLHRRLLEQADALRRREGVRGVSMVRFIDPDTGMARVTPVPVYQESFTEAVRREYQGEWGSGYRKLVFEKPEADLKRWGQELLRNDPQSAEAQAIKEWLDRFYNDYLVPRYTGPLSAARGNPMVHIGRLENWGLTRIYNADAVAANPDAFVELLMKHVDDMTLTQAWKLTDAIITGRQLLDDESLDGKSRTDKSDESGIPHTFSPGAKAKKERMLKIPIEELMPFLEQRVDKVLDSYVHSMIKRAEWDRRFAEEVEFTTKDGSRYSLWQNYYTDIIKKGAVLNSADKDTHRRAFLKRRTADVIEAYLGRYKVFETNPQVRAAMSATQAAVNWLTMPLSTLSQFPDLVGPLTRMGGGTKELMKGYRDALKAIRDRDGSLWKAAELMGVVFRDTKNLGASAIFDQQFMTEGAQRWNDRLFKYNGMQLFSNFSRIASYATSKYWLESLVHHKDGERLLGQVGLTKADVQAWIDGGYKDYTTGDNQNSVPFKIALARLRFVNESVFSPHAGQRPLWANHPYFMLVWHLKSFAYSFFTQILAPAFREVRNNPALYGKMMAVLPMGLMLPMALLGMGLRDELKNEFLPWRSAGLNDAERFERQNTWWENTSRAIGQTGVLGPIQLLLDADRAASWNRSFVFALMGPTASKLEEFYRAESTLDGLLRVTPGLSVLPQERQMLVNWWKHF